MSKERIRPMPTPEQKARARMQMAGADPFSLAMKSVDDRFPDSREKDADTLREEAEVEAMVRRIMAKRRMAAAAAAEKKPEAAAPVASAPATPAPANPVPETPKPENPVSEIQAGAPEETPETTTEKPEAEKAIEDAFEGDDVVTEEDLDEFDDEYYDDIDEMESGLYDDDELDDELDTDEPVDGGIMDEDVMKADILDEDLINDGLGNTETAKLEADIMDDFDETSDIPEAPEEQEAPVENTDGDRPVNMVLGKKAEEPEEPEEPEDGEMTVEVESMDQNMKDKIRAKQMDFGAEGATKNPLIDDDKPVPAVKDQVKMTGLESKQKKMMIGIIALAVLAVGGVLFGVVAMIKQGNVSEEIAQQMAMVNTSNSSSDGVDDEYIYLKDWGLKIKIVAGLTDVTYNVATDDFAEAMIWGAKKDNSISYTPDFARQAKNSNPLGTVVRVPRYERAAAGRLIWYDDYYNYYYQGPSGIPSVSESEMNWWVESYLLIKEMLTNADNYTTIEESNTIGQQQ